jgi:hypothetical protein
MLAKERLRYEHRVAPLRGLPAFESGRDAARDLDPEQVAQELLRIGARTSTGEPGPATE